MLLATIYDILITLLQVASTIIFVQFILSLLIMFNVIGLQNDAVRGIWDGLNKLTEPVYRPIRNLLPDTGTVDFAPMVVIIIIMLLRQTILPAIFASLMSATA